MWTKSLALCVLFLSWHAPSLSLAQGAPASGKSENACAQDAICYRRAEDAYRQFQDGQYVAALASFEAAYARRAAPHLLFNIARTLHKLGRLTEAVGYYQRFLDLGGDGNAGQMEKAKVYQAQALAEATAALNSAQKRPDPQPENPPPSPPPDPPKEEPAAMPGTATTPSSEVGSALAVVPTPKETAGPTKEISSPSTPIYKRWWFWTLVGVVVVGGVAGGVAGATAGRVQPEPFRPTDPILMPTF